MAATALAVAFGLVCLFAVLYASGGPLHPALGDHPWRALACLLAAWVGLGWPRLAPPRRALRRWVAEVPKWRFNLLLAVAGTGVFSWLAWRLFQAVPHIDDSIAALFSARLFLTGRVTMPAPELAQFFWTFGVLSPADGVGHLAGIYPPGWPALLAVGQGVGLPWLVNPLLGGALAVAVAELGEELYDRALGRWAGILLLTSPFVGILSATHLAHTPTALFGCLCWWATCRLMRTGLTRYGLVAGASLGAAFLCRPATALVLGAVVALLPLARPRRLIRVWRGALAALSLVALAVGLLLLYQRATTGDPFTSGHELHMGPWGKVGFFDLGDEGKHTPAMGVEMSERRLEVLNRSLLGWPVASLAIALVPFLVGRARYRELWLLAPLAGLLVFYAAFWYYELHYPGRYLFASVPMLVLLCAAGWRQAQQILAKRRRLARLPSVLVLFGALFAAAVGAPHDFGRFTPHHGDVETLLPQVIEAHEVDNAIVFVRARGRWRRGYDGQNDYYGSGFRLNDLELEGGVIYARHLPEEMGRLIAAYPGRDYYLYIFDRGHLTARLYRVTWRAGEPTYAPLSSAGPDGR